MILAGVALATLTGQGNIIGNAENAVGKYNNSVASEQQLLNEIEKYFQNYLEGGSGGNPPTPLDPVEPPEVDSDGLATENTTIKPDPNSDVQIVIPKGYAPVILNGSNSTYSLPGQDGSVKEIMLADQWNSITVEDINKGIVIVDHAITYTEGVPDFNEYVWVPIPDFEADLKRVSWNGGYYYWGTYTTGEHPIAQKPVTDVERQNKFWDDSTTTEYQDMLDSVEHYKGFYIGRYEASKGTNNIAQSKRNILPWIWGKQTEAITACESKTTDAVNMHLIYGIEWDSTLNWLVGKATISSSIAGEQKTMELADVQTNSSSWGNYDNSIGDAAINSGGDNSQNTGTSEYWKANNIYDLAGNIDEWTQEKYSTIYYNTLRGGNFNNIGSQHPVAYRYSDAESYVHGDLRISR